ncbi:hypothetical protein PJM25_07310 [Mycobacterium kansasii]
MIASQTEQRATRADHVTEDDDTLGAAVGTTSAPRAPVDAANGEIILHNTPFWKPFLVYLF